MPQLDSQLIMILLPVAAYSSFFCGMVIFFKRRDILAFHFLVLNILAGGWAFGFANLITPSSDPVNAHRWGYAAQICFFLIPPVWRHFVSVYTRSFKQSGLRVVLSYAVTLTLFFMFPEGFIVSYWERSGFRYLPAVGPVYHALTAAAILIMLDAFWDLGRYVRTEKAPLKKEDGRFLFCAQAYGYSLMFLSLLPVYGSDFPQYHLLILPFWQFVLTYAAIRYDLLNSEALAKTMHRDRLAALATVTASMQHELKNPLTAIKTFAEYLPVKYEDPVFRKKFSDIIPVEVARVNELLRQLLEFSRAEEPLREMVDVGELLAKTAEFLAPSCAAGAIEVEKNIQPALMVTADKNQLRQVFLNLIINSIQAMPKGGKLSFEALRFGDKEIQVRLSDTGSGIAPQVADKIGEPFFTTKDQGTGLGLSIVRNILDKHDAKLTIKSQEGVGTTVLIRMRALL